MVKRTAKRTGFGRIIGRSYLTPYEIKEGRILPLKDAEKLVSRRRKQGHRVTNEPHDGISLFSRIKFLKKKTKVHGEHKLIRVETKIWDIARKK